MTTPTTGHPDFQSYTQWRGPILFKGAYSITSPQSTGSSGFVTNWASLLIRVVLTSGTGVTVTVTYYDDQTLTNKAGTYQWICSFAPVTLSVVVPNLGNWAVVSISTGQAGANAGTAYVAACNLLVPGPRYQVTPNAASGFSVNIIAGATLSTLLPYVAEGNGTVFAQCSVATAPYTVEVDHLNEGANILDEPARVASVTGPQLLNYIASAYPLLLKITNNDAAAHTYTYHAQVLGG